MNSISVQILIILTPACFFPFLHAMEHQQQRAQTQTIDKSIVFGSQVFKNKEPYSALPPLKYLAVKAVNDPETIKKALYTLSVAPSNTASMALGLLRRPITKGLILAMTHFCQDEDVSDDEYTKLTKDWRCLSEVALCDKMYSDLRKQDRKIRRPVLLLSKNYVVLKLMNKLLQKSSGDKVREGMLQIWDCAVRNTDCGSVIVSFLYLCTSVWQEGYDPENTKSKSASSLIANYYIKGKESDSKKYKSYAVSKDDIKQHKKLLTALQDHESVLIELTTKLMPNKNDASRPSLFKALRVLSNDYKSKKLENGSVFNNYISEYIHTLACCALKTKKTPVLASKFEHTSGKKFARIIPRDPEFWLSGDNYKHVYGCLENAKEILPGKVLGDILNIADGEGNTALQYAVRSRSRLWVSLLIDHGAKIGIRNNLGKTPFHECTERVSERVKKIFKNNEYEKIYISKKTATCLTALVSAAAKLPAVAARSLINQKDWSGSTALYNAIRLPNFSGLDIAKELVLEGAYDDATLREVAHRMESAILTDVQKSERIRSIKMWELAGMLMDAKYRISQEQPLNSRVWSRNISPRTKKGRRKASQTYNPPRLHKIVGGVSPRTAFSKAYIAKPAGSTIKGYSVKKKKPRTHIRLKKSLTLKPKKKTLRLSTPETTDSEHDSHSEPESQKKKRKGKDIIEKL
jgi:ankyrin repeat protein